MPSQSRGRTLHGSCEGVGLLWGGPIYEDTIEALEAKHPFKPPPSMPSTIFSETPLVAEVDTILGCIKSFPKGTSCGRELEGTIHFVRPVWRRVCCGHGSLTCNHSGG